jgi:hypothetical protein
MKAQRHTSKLTPAEAKALEQFIQKNGGQIAAGAFFGIAPSTLSRTANRHTAPSPLLRKQLVNVGIVKA